MSSNKNKLDNYLWVSLSGSYRPWSFSIQSCTLKYLSNIFRVAPSTTAQSVNLSDTAISMNVNSCLYILHHFLTSSLLIYTTHTHNIHTHVLLSQTKNLLYSIYLVCCWWSIHNCISCFFVPQEYEDSMHTVESLLRESLIFLLVSQPSTDVCLHVFP